MKKMTVWATSPLMRSTTRRVSIRYSRIVPSIQNTKSMTKATSRSPLLATSTSRTIPSGVVISRRSRLTPSRKRLIRSSLCAIAGPCAVGQKIADPEHEGREPDRKPCRRVADELPQPAFDEAGKEQHQHRAAGEGRGGGPVPRQIVEAAIAAGEENLLGDDEAAGAGQ